MFDLLKENWVQDGIAAVFSTTTRSKGCDGDYCTEICDLDTGYWGDVDLEMGDICAMAKLIAHAPDMYRLLHSIAATKTASLNQVKALLAEIEA